jgi:hypothetical protein
MAKLILESSYRDRLQNIPPPGCGCHTFLLSVANSGVIAGIEADQIFRDIRANIPEGTRAIPDREFEEAIKKAVEDYRGGTFTPGPRPAPVVKDGAAARQKILQQGKFTGEAELMESSPIHLLDGGEKDPRLFLETLFSPGDLIWIGDRHDLGIVGQNIMTVKGWAAFFQAGGNAGPHLLINPLTGQSAPKKSCNGITYRGDENVHAFRYCLVEFDTLSREDQFKFWSAVDLPVRAIIDTGNKSLHGLIDVQKLAKVQTSEDWDRHVKCRLFDQILIPLGIDGSCKNPARLSRMPGHYRLEKEKYQRLLWLSPEGRKVCL